MRGLQQVQKYGLLVAVGLLSLGLTAAVPVSADPGAPDGGKGAGYMRHGNCGGAWHGGKRWAHLRHYRHRMMHAFKQLDLSEAQKSAIHGIRISLKKDMIQKRAEMKIARIELGEQLRKDTVDMSAIEAQLKKVESLRTSMKLSAIKARVEIKNKLTPEQRKKLADLMQQPWQDKVQRPPQG